MKRKFIIYISIFLVILSNLILFGCGAPSLSSSQSLPKYVIMASLNEQTMSLSCEMKIEYSYFGENSLTNILFFLPANLQKLNKRGMEIKSVYADNAQIGFSERGEYAQFLDIPTPRELFLGDRIEIKINYELDIPQSTGIWGYGERVIKISGWYPVICPRIDEEWVENEYSRFGDYLFSSCADYEVKFRANQDLVVASSGKRVSQTKSEDRITYVYEGKGMRDFALSCSKEYEVVSGTAGGTLISVYDYDKGRGQEILKYAKQAINLFNDRFGGYSYPTYSVASCELEAGGMEFSGLTYISEDLVGVELEEVVAHETAHQWWYDGVGSNPTTHAWLDEGLTEYSVLEYIGEYRGLLERENKVRENYNSYALACNVESSLSGRYDFAMNKKTNQYDTLYQYVLITYVKGSMFFDNLRSIVGRQRFNKLLKNYYACYKGLISTPEDFREFLESQDKINYEPIFSGWIEGKLIFYVK